MSLKDKIAGSIASSVAVPLIKALDEKLDGKKIVDDAQAVLRERGLSAKSIKVASEGPLMHITVEMQEGLWDDKLALADEYERLAKLLRGAAK